MTIQNTYRKAVQMLPVNQKKKMFLSRNWMGALIMFMYSVVGVFLFPKVSITLVSIFFAPIRFLTLFIWEKLVPSGAGLEAYALIIPAIGLMVIILTILGAVLQNIFRIRNNNKILMGAIVLFTVILIYANFVATPILEKDINILKGLEYNGYFVYFGNGDSYTYQEADFRLSESEHNFDLGYITIHQECKGSGLNIDLEFPDAIGGPERKYSFCSGNGNEIELFSVPFSEEEYATFIYEALK